MEYMVRGDGYIATSSTPTLSDYGELYHKQWMQGHIGQHGALLSHDGWVRSDESNTDTKVNKKLLLLK